MTRINQVKLALIFGLVFAFLLVTPAFAVVRYWTGLASTSTTEGGKDFWNVANWDTAVPASGDDIFFSATNTVSTQTASSTIIISTPVDLGAGNVDVGYNEKVGGAGLQPVILIIKAGASLTTTGYFKVATSTAAGAANTVSLQGGSLNVGTTTLGILASTTVPNISGASTSTIRMRGDVTLGAGARFSVVTGATTTFIGTTGTVTVSATSTTNTFGYLNLSGTGTIQFRIASSTVNNRFRIDPTATYSGSTNSTTGFPNGITINLLGANTNSDSFPFEPNGTFTVSTTTVVFGGSAAATVASTTYYSVRFTGATYTLRGNTTVTNTATINSGTTLALSTLTFTATGATWTNRGTVTASGGKVTLASTAIFSDSASTADSAFTAPSEQVCVDVTDSSLNYLAASAETQTATVTATSQLTDSETFTLTETSATSGIFNGCMGWTLSGSDTVGVLDFNGNGTLSFSYTDSQDGTDTGSGNATFTGASAGGGGGGVVTYAVGPTYAGAAAPATPATRATSTVAIPATPATPAVPAVPAAPTAPAQPTTIEGIQARIQQLLAQIRELQGPATAPQGVALGFRFVRPLALGSRHADVRKLQEALGTDSEVYPEGLVTGYFGPATRRAVQRFQEKYGLARPGVSGYGFVGPKTRAKLNELYGE